MWATCWSLREEIYNADNATNRNGMALVRLDEKDDDPNMDNVGAISLPIRAIFRIIYPLLHSFGLYFGH
jgi:hypothetical protein